MVGAVELRNSATDCPGHWHSTFLVFMDDHRVRFDRPIFYQTPGGIHDYHMHAADQIIHFHPQWISTCIGLGRFMGRLGISLTETSISFNENFGANNGTYLANGTHSLEVHHQPFDQEWRQVEWAELQDRQPLQGDKFLFTYGELTPEIVEAQKDQVRDLGPNYLPPEYRERAREILNDGP